MTWVDSVNEEIRLGTMGKVTCVPTTKTKRECLEILLEFPVFVQPSLGVEQFWIGDESKIAADGASHHPAQMKMYQMLPMRVEPFGMR